MLYTVSRKPAYGNKAYMSGTFLEKWATHAVGMDGHTVLQQALGMQRRELLLGTVHIDPQV